MSDDGAHSKQIIKIRRITSELGLDRTRCPRCLAALDLSPAIDRFMEGASDYLETDCTLQLGDLGVIHSGRGHYGRGRKIRFVRARTKRNKAKAKSQAQQAKDQES